MRKTCCIVFIIIFSLVLTGVTFQGLSMLFRKKTEKGIDELELVAMFHNHYQEFNDVTNSLYNKPGFWEKMDESRKYNWSLDPNNLANVEYVEYYEKKDWEKIVCFIKTIKPIRVTYRKDAEFIDYSFMGYSKRGNEMIQLYLCYVPAEDLTNEQKVELINKQYAWNRGSTQEITNNWYYRKDYGLDVEKLQESLKLYYN